MLRLLSGCVVLAVILSSQAQQVPTPPTAHSTAKSRTVRVHNGFLKAQEFLEMPEDHRGMYAMGILDGMYLAPLFGAPDNDKSLLSIETCVEDMTASQVAAIIRKYVQDHPERWHWDLNQVAHNAMLGACSQ